MSTPDKSSTQQLRSAGLLGILTVLSRVLGLIREIVVATILGTSILSDAFTLAFSIPDLFRRLFAEGALVNAFIPSFTFIKKNEGPEEASRFAGSFMLILGAVTGVICLLSILAAPILVKYTIAFGYTGAPLNSTILLTQIMLGYIVLISMASIYQGVLNSFNIFWVSSLTPILLNLSVICFALLLSPYLENPAIGFAIGVMVGGLIQFLFHIPFVYKLNFKIHYRFDWSNPYLKHSLTLMIPTIFGVGVYQINIVISNMIASTLQIGSVSSLKFSNRLLELIIGVFVVSLATVILPKLSTLFVDEKLDQIRKNLEFALSTMFFLTLPIALGGVLLAEEIVTLLFARGEFGSHSILLTSSAFKLHLIGLCFIAWNRIFLTCFQATGYLKPMVISGVWVVISNVGLAFILKEFLGHHGIALATSMSQFIHTVLLVFFLRKHSLPNPNGLLTSKNNIQSLVSASIMVGILYYVKSFQIFAQNPVYINFSIFIALGAVIYFFLSFLLKNEVLAHLSKALLARS